HAWAWHNGQGSSSPNIFPLVVKGLNKVAAGTHRQDIRSWGRLGGQGLQRIRVHVRAKSPGLVHGYSSGVRCSAFGVRSGLILTPNAERRTLNWTGERQILAYFAYRTACSGAHKSPTAGMGWLALASAAHHPSRGGINGSRGIRRIRRAIRTN